MPRYDDKLHFRTAGRAAVPRNWNKVRSLVQESPSDIPSNDNPLLNSGRPRANNKELYYNAPAAPGVVIGFMQTGDNPGEIIFTVSTPLPEAGDEVVYGDGLASLASLWLVNTEGDEILVTAELPYDGEHIISGFDNGGFYQFAWYMRNSADRDGTLSDFVGVIAGDVEVDPDLEPPTIVSNAFPDLEIVAGSAFSVDWSTKFDGADTYVVDSGITGGISSGTGDKDYDVADVPEGMYTIVVTAFNDDGSITGTWNINAAAAAEPPAFKDGYTDVPDYIVAVDGTVDDDFSKYIKGSDNVYSCSEDDAEAIQVESNGQIHNTSALTVEMATTVYNVSVTNATAEVLNFTTSVGVTAEPADALEADDVLIPNSTYEFGATTYRRPIVMFAQDMTDKYLVGWSRDGAGPDGTIVNQNHIETLPKISGSGVDAVWQPYQTNPAQNGVFTPVRLDYSVWTAGDARPIYFTYKDTISSPWAKASIGYLIPPVSVDPVSELPWLPVMIRRQESLVAAQQPPSTTFGYVVSPGMQYQRIVEQNRRAKIDPAKANTFFTGQDENNMWWSQDGGRSWSSCPMLGMYANVMCGIYACSDDNDGKGFVIAIGGSDDKNAEHRGGMYISEDWGQTAYYMPLMRGSTKGFVQSANGGSARLQQNCIARRPQNDAGTLTDAQRPTYAIEQQVQGAGNASIASDTIIGIYLWTCIGAPNVVANWSYRTLTLATFCDDDDGIYHITVDNNGDILMSGKKGAWFSDDGGLSFTKMVSYECKMQFLQDGIARLGITQSPYGVLTTNNIRTTGFTKPASAGMASDYRVNHMGVFPSNPNKWLICGYKQADPKAGQTPLITTNAGASYSAITSQMTPGDGQSARYAFNREASGFYPNRAVVNEVFGVTFQTLSLSIDGGASFQGWRCTFFDGSHSKGWGYDPDDWSRTLHVQGDRLVQVGADGVLGYDNGEIALGTSVGGTTLGALVTAAGGGSDPGISGGGGALLPSGVVLIGCNRSRFALKNVPVLLWPNGGEPYGNIRVVDKNGHQSACRNTYFNPAVAHTLFMGSWYIPNTAAAPGSMAFNDRGYEIQGYSYLSGVLSTYWMPKDDDVKVIRRSTANDGSSISAWYTRPSGADINRITVAVDPFTSERVLFSSVNSAKIYEVKKVSGVLTETLLVDMADLVKAVLLAQIGVKTVYPDIEVRKILFDPNTSGLVYAVIDTGHGMPNIWASFDGGTVWHDITDNLPRTAILINIHPLTGTLFARSSKGTWCRKPPQAVSYAAIPNFAADYNQLVEFYARPDIEDVPVTYAVA